MKKYQIVRHYNGTTGYGRVFDTEQEAREYLETDERILQDKADGFGFSVKEIDA